MKVGYLAFVGVYAELALFVCAVKRLSRLREHMAI